MEAGDKVRIIGQDTIGELMQINAKNAVVAFGQLITTMPRNKVEKVSNNEAKKAAVDKTKPMRMLRKRSARKIKLQSRN